MRYRVLFNNILVKPQEKKGTVLIADDSNIIRAEVVEIGNGDYFSMSPVTPNAANFSFSFPVRYPIEVRPSSIVWFDTRSATLFKTGEEKFYILNQNDILIVEED